MRRTVRHRAILIFAICIALNPIAAQESEFYSIASALRNKDSVKALVLNLNDTTITPSLEGIGELVSLEELIVFGVSSAIHGPIRFHIDEEWEAKHPNDAEVLMIPAEYYYDTAVMSIPEEIGNCTKLRILSIDEAPITHLPKSLSRLQDLEVLKLGYTRVPETEWLEIIQSLKKLRLLDIYDAQISSGSLNQLKEALPACRFITTFHEYKEIFPIGQRIWIGKNKIAQVIPTEKEALQFLNSLPAEMCEHFEVEYWLREK